MVELSSETLAELAWRFYAGDSRLAISSNAPQLRRTLLEEHSDCTIYVTLLTDEVLRVNTAFFARGRAERRVARSHEFAYYYPDMFASASLVELTPRLLEQRSIIFPVYGALRADEERSQVYGGLYRDLGQTQKDI